MQQEKQAIRFGVGALAAALAIQLISISPLRPVLRSLVTPETACVLMFLETGRLARPVAARPQASPQPSVEPPSAQAVFSKEDALLIKVNSYCGYEAEPTELLKMPLDWDLTQEGPQVLIVHTHGSESYQKRENYTETSRYRTLNTQYNMVSVGDRLAQLLEDGGVEVLHDRTVHDHPSYTNSYNESRKSIKKYLEQYPSIRLVLDVHRDALQDSEGNQIGYTVETAVGTAARVMMVVGTDAAGLKHPKWKENLALAAKLHAQLEKNTPGLCRPISFRTQRFNQDLSPGAMLLEIGAAGNTRQEALCSAALIAQGILDLARGTEDPVW